VTVSCTTTDTSACTSSTSRCCTHTACTTSACTCSEVYHIAVVKNESCSLTIEKCSYYYLLSASEFNNFITCISVKNRTVRGCFNSHCTLTYTAPTKLPHAILLHINPCSTKIINYTTRKRPWIQRVGASVGSNIEDAALKSRRLQQPTRQWETSKDSVIPNVIRHH
jgi:hypothetical protein